MPGILPPARSVLCGDCLDVLPVLPAASVDVVITAPPADLGIAYECGDRLEEAEYLDWMVRVAGAIKRVLKPDGSFFLNVAGSSLQPWLPFELIVRLRPLFALQNHIAWVKSIDTGPDSAGHDRPVPGERFLHRNHDSVFHLTQGGGVRLDRLAIGVACKDEGGIARRGPGRDLRCRGDTWFLPYPDMRAPDVRTRAHSHPGAFPADLPRWCIRLHGRPGAVVLDPFAGTGTTLLAAAAEGAHGIGIELDPALVEVARDALERMDGLVQTDS